MRVEIEVPNLPDGYEAVGPGIAEGGDLRPPSFFATTCRNCNFDNRPYWKP